ncbi:MAG: DUF3289 family protein [Treponema sp.]|nr:DUF3289 family protein [Treponema sp.]
MERTELPFPLTIGEGNKTHIEDDYKASDMKYGTLEGSRHIHEENDFSLSKIEDVSIIEKLEKDIKLPKETLIARFENLAKLTSMGALQTINLDLIKKFVNDNDKPKSCFNNKTLTDKVLKHEETKEFKESIVNVFRSQLDSHKGVLRKVNIPDKDIIKPNFSKILDPFKGLMFAIHSIQACYASVTEYAYDAERKEFDAVIEITLHDHFGMSYVEQGNRTAARSACSCVPSRRS